MRCHSIHWNPRFVSEPKALGDAMNLRSQVVNYCDQGAVPVVSSTSWTWKSSSLKKSRASKHRQVRFHSFVEICIDSNCYAAEPLSSQTDWIAQDHADTDLFHPDQAEGDVSTLMARAPRPREPSTSPSIDSDEVVHTPTSPSSSAERTQWRSVQVYDLKSNYARGRVPVQPRERTFAQMRRLLGYRHHDVAEIFTVNPGPDDLSSLHVTPMLLVAHDDLQWGDHRRAILVDIELHGSSYDTVVEIDRYTTLLPSPIHRKHLLKTLGITSYCEMQQHRCLLWVRGQLAPLQGNQLIDLQHGDYIRAAVPPFDPPEVPTFYAVRACQQGLNRAEIVDHHRRQPEFEDFLLQEDTDQENALLDQDVEDNGLLQISSCNSSDAQDLAPQTAKSMVPHECGVRRHFQGQPTSSPNFWAQAPGMFLPNRRQTEDVQPWPSWLESLHRVFVDNAAVAHEDEGPIAFVTTWYLRGPFESKTEESRALQLDQFTSMWIQDATELWRDKIDLASPLDFVFVQPELPRHETQWTIGHLILYQHVTRPRVPALIAIKFLGDRGARIGYVAATITTPTTTLNVKDHCNLARLCTTRKCTLQLDERHFEGVDPVHLYPGIGLIFNIHPPVHLVHVGDDQVVSPHLPTISSTVAGEILEAVPQLEDQTEFTQALFEHWDIMAREGPGHMERLLTIVTWCLQADRVRMNDEARLAMLADDFHLWESQIQRIWTDILDPNIDVDFTIVWPSPDDPQGPPRLHVIVHQSLSPTERATLVTIYDDGIMNNMPYTTAVILPAVVGRSDMIWAVHRSHSCPPYNSGNACSTWHGGWEISDQEPYRARHGMSFMLIIQRLQHVSWDDDDEMHPEATASTSLMQVRAVTTRTPSINSAPTNQSDGSRRLTAGQVAHTLRPGFQTILLQDLIAPPSTVQIDFSPVLHLHDEMKNLGHLFGQPWPTDLPAPPDALVAFEQLVPIDLNIPIAFHFYTDGSKATDTPVGVGVILLIESSAGLHYGGCLYKVIEADKSIYGEYGAIIWALLWAHHLSEQHWLQYGTSAVWFSFNFDSTSAGFMAAGYWQALCAPDWKVLARSLAQTLQTRHGLDHIIWRHVKAHAGHAWNECADHLAKYAAQQPGLAGNSAFWENWLQNPDKLLALQWLWYKELLDVQDPRVPPLLHGQLHCVLPTPAKPPPPSPASSTAATTSIATTLTFVIATANVMTLEKMGRSTSSISRQTILMEQFHQAGCAIVGVQETRHCHIVVDDEGTKIGKKDVRIVFAESNLLIAKLKLAQWTCIVVTCRAPHSGRPLAEAIAFWSRVNNVLQRKAAGLPIFFCGDANAHLGEYPTDAVGTLAPDAENQAGRLFHEWLLTHSLMAPATFEHLHHGDAHHTYVSPGEQFSTRIDYVAVPQHLQYKNIKSWVATEIDLTLTGQDHTAVLCQISVVLNMPRSHQRVRTFQPDCAALASNLQTDESFHQLHASVSAPPWYLDPHDSADWLACSTRQALQHLAPPRHQWRRKSHITDQTWALVDTKKAFFKQLRALKRTKFFTTLQACFLSWKSCSQPSFDTTWLHRDLPHWLKLHDQAVATTMRSLRISSQQVQQAVRTEDANYYQSIANQTAKTFSVEGLNGIWRHLRAILPKHKAKTQHAKRDIDAELLCHFERLEAGRTMPESELFAACFERNLLERDRQVQTRFLALDELPTLVEIENQCLRQKAHKSPGIDGIPADLCKNGAAAIAPQLHSVVCKALIYGVEPYCYKGGRLCAIYKGKGDLDDAQGYRGILLTNSFAKIVHGWARRRLLPTLQERKTIGQLGGLPSQQTTTGVQIVRLHSQVGAAKHVSTATLFVDLRSAFHHMLREFIFATHNSLAASVLSAFLDDKDFNVEQIARSLDELCSSPVDDISPGLRQFLHDVHHHTWFCLQPDSVGHNRSVTHTLRGTRPGSPIADIGFNLLSTEVLKEIQIDLMEDEDYCAGCEALGVFVPPVAWMDDIALCLATARAVDLEPLAQRALALVHKAFCRRGLTINLDKGKTELILMPRGAQAAACRTRIFDRSSFPTVTTTTDTHVLTVRVVSAYRHLGVKFAMNLDYDAEITARLGAARQAFEQMRKSIFQNLAVPLQGRLTLFQSLILSRLFYGCSAWAELSATTFRKLDAAVIGYYRRICNVGFWTSDKISDKDFLHSRQLTPFRIFWARQRLCYLQHVAQHGLTFHKVLLLAEFAENKGWLYEVAEDLRWMSSFYDLPFAVPHDRASWSEAWKALRDCPQWKRWVQRSVLKHLEQQKIAYEIRTYHAQIQAELESYGMRLVQTSDPPPSLPTFGCADCEIQFPSAQQLAMHNYRIHGLRALERYYVHSEVCPGCLKTFHTTYRVVQHLRYRANQCWERIYGFKLPDTPAHIELPSHLQGVHRLPAVRRHHGPLRPTRWDRDRMRVRDEMAQVYSAGEEDFAWTAFTIACSRLDFQTFMPRVFSYIGSSTTSMTSLCPVQAPRSMTSWPADILERAHMALLSDLHIWHLRMRMVHLTTQWERLQYAPPSAPRPNSLGQRRAARVHSIDDDFSGMREEELLRRTWRMAVRPGRFPTSEQGPYYVVHLYAGRRREQDFHAYIAEFIQQSDGDWTAALHILSIDTAIDEKMNVHSDSLWGFLISAARTGRIVGYLLGPPCETWSSARFEEQVDNQGKLVKGPRPLRHAEACWGIAQLTLKELQQLSVGSCLFLRGLWLCIPVALSGGAVILEHPAIPFQEDRPSIFKTGLVTLLLRDGWLFKRHTFQQWKHGSEGIKPTCLLYANNQIPQTLDTLALSGVQKPTEALIGRGPDGRFRTSKAKEYPANLSQCFASAIWDQICALPIRSDGAAQPPQLATEFAEKSAWVEPSKDFLPDYQPYKG
eukprot:s1573_g6.t1